MSATSGELSPKVNRDLTLLAPKFRQAVIEAIAACQNANPKLDAMVYEGYRTNELQALYYARGRTVIPPAKPVTNAPTNLYSWHGYGLAVDIVHRQHFWSPPGGEQWFQNVAAVIKALKSPEGEQLIKWGGDWKKPDTPHFQWAKCPPSPSKEARDLLAKSGLQAVWDKLGAA